MMERIEHVDVEGIRVGRLPFQINTTCIVYRLGTTVIDTGPPNQWRAVRRFLLERDVRRVIVTHHHEDHSGNLAAIHRTMDPAIFSPPSGIPALSGGFSLNLYQRILWGRPDRVRPEPIPERIRFDTSTLQTIHAPGHSADMTCYLEPERGWLFTGDLFIGSKTRYLREDEDLRLQMGSLRRVLEYDFETVFCSHRGVVRPGKAALRRKLDYLESLCERVQHLRRQGKGVKEITRELLGREDLMSWATGFHFSKRNLIEACFKAAALH